MEPPNNILVLIVAFIVSVQSSSRNIASGSVAYDPNSIRQNEKILRLFLRLASNTANRLIYLKNDVHALETSTTKNCAEGVVPEMRMRLSDVERGPYNTEYYDHSSMVGPYAPAPAEEVLPPKYGRYRHRYGPHRRNAEKNSTEKKLGNSSRDIDDAAHDESIEIASRMFFIGDKNNGATYRENHSKNVNNSDPAVMSSPVSDALNIQSAASTAALKLSGVSDQAKTAISNLQSGSSGLENAIQGIKTVINNFGAAEMTPEGLGVTSGLQSRGLSAKIQNVTGSAAVTGQIEAAALTLHSASSGILDLAKSAALEARSKVTTTQESRRASDEASNVESDATEKSTMTTISPDAVTAPDDNFDNRTVEVANFRILSHPVLGNNEALGALVRNKSGEIISKIDSGTSLSMNQASLLADSGRAMTGIAGVGIRESAKVVQAAGDSGSKVIGAMAVPVESVVANMVKLSEDSIGSKINASGISEGSLGLRNTIESGFHGGSASSAMIESVGGGASQISSRLLGAVPLFRSFSDVYNESSGIGNINEIDDGRLNKNVSEEINNENLPKERVSDDQKKLGNENEALTVLGDLQSGDSRTGGRLSFLKLEYGNNEDAYEDSISDSDLQDLGRQFADALRPIGVTKEPQSFEAMSLPA